MKYGAIIRSAVCRWLAGWNCIMKKANILP